MVIYGVPGLGADERVFACLGVDIQPIRWIKPAPEDTLASYAFKLIPQIDQSSPYILLGVSFGGMLVSEMSKYINPYKVILISSVAASCELPRSLRLLRALPKGLLNWSVNRLHPPPAFIMNKVFGVNSRSGQHLLQMIIKETDVSFMTWAIHSILHWQNTSIPENLIRIHGSADRLLPPPSSAYIKVEGGGHFMIVEEAELIKTLIHQQMNK